MFVLVSFSKYNAGITRLRLETREPLIFKQFREKYIYVVSNVPN